MISTAPSTQSIVRMARPYPAPLQVAENVVPLGAARDSRGVLAEVLGPGAGQAGPGRSRQEGDRTGTVVLARCADQKAGRLADAQRTDEPQAQPPGVAGLARPRHAGGVLRPALRLGECEPAGRARDDRHIAVTAEHGQLGSAVAGRITGRHGDPELVTLARCTGNPRRVLG